MTCTCGSPETQNAIHRKNGKPCYKCGCSYGEVVGIEYCKLHASAPDLKAANEKMRWELQRIAENDCQCGMDPKWRDLHYDFCSVGIAKQALTP